MAENTTEDIFEKLQHLEDYKQPGPPPPIPPGFRPDGQPAGAPPVPPMPPVDIVTMPPKNPPGPPPKPYRSPKDPYAHAGDIDNLAQMRNYILQQLGSPVICIELSEDQLNNAILDTVRYVQRYYMDVGSYRDYLVMELKKGITHYKICQELENAVSFELTNGLAAGMNDLFTASHNLLYNEMNSLNGWQFAGSCWGNSSSFGDVLGSWNASLLWLKELRNDFGPSFQIRYNNLDHELSVWPTPKKDCLGLLWVYRRQTAQHIFNNPLFRRMAVAAAGKVWTTALGKYSITLAGGRTVEC